MKWIETRLKELGKKKSDLAAAIGRSPQVVTEIINNRRPIKQPEIARMADFLEVDASVFTRSNVEEMKSKFVEVQIKGVVQAGDWSQHDQWDEWETIWTTPVDEYPRIALHACRVVGDSMDKVYPEGTILIWVNILETQEVPVSGRRYIVKQERYDGLEHELTVKTYIENERGKWLVAESTNPEWQRTIKWANGETDSVQIIGRVVRSIRNE